MCNRGGESDRWIESSLNGFFIGTINKFHVYIKYFFVNIKKKIHILKLNEKEVGTILLVWLCENDNANIYLGTE